MVQNKILSALFTSEDRPFPPNDMKNSGFQCHRQLEVHVLMFWLAKNALSKKTYTKASFSEDFH
ncbi:hypothetical protein DHW03_06660 [Pedobacter yonginense]|uniref:Uncharacterized protein n=1 Tax=Pedobacter yonginense TaxID=651869 RepID=A0A317EWA0_9SPHI|nr:hypothetical protein DHW03_06660 [Pedobacter yonginense]